MTLPRLLMPNPKARPAPLPERGGKSLPATTADLVLSVSKTTVHLETLELLAVPPDAVRGFDVKHKRNGPNDLFVHGLVGPLSWARERSRSMQQAAGQDPSSTPLLVLADGALPYRVIVEILFTAGQQEYTPHLAGLKEGKVVDMDLAPALRARAIARPTLGLSVVVGPDGFSVKARGASLSPGCNGVGPGPAVPKNNGAYDYGQLTRCAEKLKQLDPDAQDETTATVSAEWEISYQTVISTNDALRKNERGDLFPEVSLGIVR